MPSALFPVAVAPTMATSRGRARESELGRLTARANERQGDEGGKHEQQTQELCAGVLDHVCFLPFLSP